MVSRYTGGGLSIEADRILLCDGSAAASSLPLYLGVTLLGTLEMKPLVRIPPALVAGDDDGALADGLCQLRVLRCRHGSLTLETPTELDQVNPSAWVWASPGHRATAWNTFNQQHHLLFPGDVAELPSSDDDTDDSSSNNSDWPDDDSDSTYRPSDDESTPPSEEDEEPQQSSSVTRKRLQYADILNELTAWVSSPQGYRTFARSRQNAPSRFLRLMREWFDAVYSPPIVVPCGAKRPPCLIVRLRSLDMGLRLVEMRSRAALAAIEKGEPPQKRPRAAPRGPRAEVQVQRGPTLASLRLPNLRASASVSAARPTDRRTYYALYIDTAGGRIGGARLTTAAIRKAPPDPPHSSADLRSLVVFGAWLGSFKGRAPARFISSLPAFPPNTIHHHDLSSFWQLSNADAGVSCCALDTKRAKQYWTKKPCVCNGSLRDIHNINRLPNSSGVLPNRPLYVKGTNTPMEYVYPRGHCVKNTIMSIWGTLCIVVAKYDNDLANRLEREFPRGDGFNPNLRDYTEKEKSERKTRKPPVDGRCRNAKEFVRKTDAYIESLLSEVRDTEILRIGASIWSVRRFIMFTIQYLRCLLDPEPDMAFEYLQQLGRTLFYVYKRWLALEFPYHVDCRHKDQFSDLSREDIRKLRSDIQFNTAEVQCGVPVHYAFEHAMEPFLKYPFEVAASLQLEECEENSFLEFAEKVPKLTQRRLQRVPYLRGVGEAVLTISITGWPGQTDERNRRYWSWTDPQRAPV